MTMTDEQLLAICATILLAGARGESGDTSYRPCDAIMDAHALIRRACAAINPVTVTVEDGR